MAAADAPKMLSGMRPFTRVMIQKKNESSCQPNPERDRHDDDAGMTRMMRKNTASRLRRPVVTVTSTG